MMVGIVREEFLVGEQRAHLFRCEIEYAQGVAILDERQLAPVRRVLWLVILVFIRNERCFANHRARVDLVFDVTSAPSLLNRTPSDAM